MPILISGGHVATMDPDLGDLPGADVLLQDGVIVAVGPGLAERAPRARRIEARGRLVMPGLIDTHRHVWQGAIGGSTGKVSLTGYSAEVIARLAPLYQPEDIYAGTLWGALQALNAGITTIADWSHNLASPAHADANVRALRQSGIGGCSSTAVQAHMVWRSSAIPRPRIPRTPDAPAMSCSPAARRTGCGWASPCGDRRSLRPRSPNTTSSSPASSACPSRCMSAWPAFPGRSTRSTGSGCSARTSTSPTRPGSPSGSSN